MNSRMMILAASIALALAAPAFAQDNPQTTPAAPADDQAQAAPADSQSMNSDATQPAATTRHHRVKHHRATRQSNAHVAAHMALTGNEPRIVAYQTSDRVKTYPAIDRGHVPGDPPIIDHSGDQAPTTPTSTSITIPPSTH